MSKHTSGPWSVFDMGDMQWIMDSGGSYLAEIIPNDEEGRYVNDKRERAANAELMAAAPELKALLDEMVADYGFNRCDEKRLETIAAAKKVLRRFP